MTALAIGSSIAAIGLLISCVCLLIKLKKVEESASDRLHQVAYLKRDIDKLQHSKEKLVKKMERLEGRLNALPRSPRKKRKPRISREIATIRRERDVVRAHIKKFI